MKLRLIKIKSIKSTNDIAILLIKKDEFKPTLITTLIQSKGRGTMGKKWISQKGNLFISIFFEIKRKTINYKQYALLNAYLLKNIITKFSKKKIDIKWPNDLLIKKQKICGILQEIVQFDAKTFLIVGVGINTNVSPLIKNCKVTSLKNVLKKDIDNNDILKKIKMEYENFIQQMNKCNFAKLKKRYSK